jgi:hypothetical protein
MLFNLRDVGVYMWFKMNLVLCAHPRKQIAVRIFDMSHQSALQKKEDRTRSSPRWMTLRYFSTIPVYILCDVYLVQKLHRGQIIQL